MPEVVLVVPSRVESFRHFLLPALVKRAPPPRTTYLHIRQEHLDKQRGREGARAHGHGDLLPP